MSDPANLLLLLKMPNKNSRYAREFSAEGAASCMQR